MSVDVIIRAWRDRDFWSSLSEDERARIPANPAGIVELLDADLVRVVGGCHLTTFLTCHTGVVCCD